MIGFWLISLAITIFFMFFLTDFTVKEKVIGVFGFMAFITILIAGVYFLVGGA